MRAGLRRRVAGVVFACLMLSAALPSATSAYTAAHGYSAQGYVTGFPESAANDWGPIGVAFDQSNNLYVADTADGNIYRFQPGGGVASADTRLTQSPIPGKISGLAISGSGDLYLARYGAGDVVQVDPDTGQVTRTVASVPCATGLAVDPASGDLFVSENQCGSTIWRVSGFDSGAGTVTTYAQAPGVDGLAFDSSGDLYAESDGSIIRIDGTQSATPGLVTDMAKVPKADGLAFGAHTSGQPPFLVANGNNGAVTRVDFDQSPPAETQIFTGGSRGDFATVDASGCLYITQSASIVRISGANDTCGFEPTTPGATTPVAPGLTASVLSATANRTAAACAALHTVTLRLRQRGRVRLRSALIYVNGRLVRRLRRSAVTAPIAISRLPKGSFTVKIVAITTKGKRVTTRKLFANCHKPPPKACSGTKRLTVRVHGKKVTVCVKNKISKPPKKPRGFTARSVGR